MTAAFDLAKAIQDSVTALVELLTGTSVAAAPEVSGGGSSDLTPRQSDSQAPPATPSLETVSDDTTAKETSETVPDVLPDGRPSTPPVVDATPATPSPAEAPPVVDATPATPSPPEAPPTVNADGSPTTPPETTTGPAPIDVSATGTTGP